MTLFDPGPPVRRGKRCSTCRVWKRLEEFHRRTKAADGRQSVCRECNIAAQIRFHADHPELCRERISKRARRVLDERRTLLLHYLWSHPCVDCGEPDAVVLDFDHVRGPKVANVSTLVFALKPWSVIQAEIAKCEVVCANCHRRRTAKRAGSFRFRMLRERGES